MPLKVADRVKEYTTTSGIGGVSFIGPYNGFQRFDDALSAGDTTYYVIEENDKWEVGIGTYGSHNLERNTVLASSNNNNKITLGGSGTVSIVYPASQAVFKDDFVYLSGVVSSNQDELIALSGWTIANVAELSSEISSVSGWAQAYVDEQDHNATAVSGWADSKFTDSANDLSSVSGWTQVGIDGVVSDLASVSGWTQAGVDSVVSDLANVSGWTQSGLDAVVADLSATSGWADASIGSLSGWTQTGLDSASSDLASVSGWTQAGVDAVVSDLANVSGWTQVGIDSVVSDLSSVSGWTNSNFTQTNLDVDYVSGIATYASGQAIQNESDIAAVSGLIGVADFLPGATGALIDQNTDDIATASGALRNSINTNAADIVTASGALRDSINANTTDIATASGALRDSINENILDIASVSGLLTPSGDHFTFSNAILTYFNSAGGSFDVDLSSISGDVYAMIVDGAPTTLDTLNEIAAALNDDANIANTLTNLISSTSGNLQSQITDNVNDLSSTSGYFETRVDDADAEITAVSGWAGTHSDAGDTAVSGWSESTFSTLLQMDYVSGIATYASGKGVTGNPSGVLYFDDAGSATGDPSFTFDGANVTVGGYIDASGERVVTSPDIHHLVQLTQAEYDALTPDSATFYIITDAPSISGYFQPLVSQNATDIVAVSGIAAYASGNTVNGDPSGIPFFGDDGAITGNNTLIYDGQSITLDGTIFATGERVITSDEIFHIKQLTQAEYDSITPDSATFYIITDASEDAAVSGYFQGEVDSLSADITTVSGLIPTSSPSGVAFFDNEGSITGDSSFIFDGQNITLDGYIDASGERVVTSPSVHHIVQLTQAEYDALTPDSATVYFITDTPSMSGYFEPRVTQNEEDIVAVSGIAAYASGNTISGEASGILYFDNTGSVTGDNTLTYDGSNITLIGNITASGKRVITSDEINHIKQLTQAEYDALTPDPATFYIITDSEVEGPIQYPIRKVYTDTSIQLTDYSLLAGSGLNFTLPTAVGNRGTLFNVKNVSAGTVIVSGVGGETIDGAVSYSMSTQYQTLTVQSDNSNWVII